MRHVRMCAVALAASGLVACADESMIDEENLGETEQALTVATDSIASPVASASQPLGGFDIDGIEPSTLTVFHLHVEAQAKWEAVIGTNLSWDADKVRQGQTLDVERTGSSLGLIKVLWTLTGELRPLDLFGINIGTIPLAVDVAGCTPPLDGGPFSCEASSPELTLHDVFLPGTPFVRIAIEVRFTGDGAPANTTRTLFLGDEAGASANLTVTPDPQGDAAPMPCSKPVGTTVDYALDPYSWSPAYTKVVQQPKFIIGIHDPILSIPITLFEAPFGPAIPVEPSFTLEGPGATVSLGELLANNVLPTIAPLGPFSGQEGAPVTFSQSTTSACPITSYVWEFSNGTTSFGPTPQRTFGDDGQFDGQLTVTDSTNLSATDSFLVNISNRPPVANAGPATSGAWGTPIALNGQAVDPGADDQATLTYTWTFGDGTPGTGGASVTHAYAAPGTYTAILKVCDDHVCSTDSTLVTVRKRTTSVAYTGTNLGTFSAAATLMGSVVDEFGQPVVGATLAFELGGASAGSAQTNATGNAARTIEVPLPAGSYGVAVGYAGSGLYDGGNTLEQFAVVQMASSIAYTGSLTGGANKTINLSAKLVDAQNRALAGKLVVFKLGTQQTSATTNASGVATTSLKLDQKNGKYPLTATWTPVPGDDAKWIGTQTSTTFTIGGGK
jgi:PKD repeat protein